MQGDSDGLCLTFLCLLRHIFYKAVPDIVPCQPVKVTDTAADIAVEYEYVPDDRKFGVVAQIRIVQDIPLFGCKVERVAVCRFLAAVEGIDLVVAVLHPLAPVQEGAEEVHDIDDGRVG